MRKLFFLVSLFITTLFFGQTIPTVPYEFDNVESTILEGKIENLDNISTYKVYYNFKNILVNGNTINTPGYVKESVYLNEYAKILDEKQPGRGSSFKGSWQLGKDMFYRYEFEKNFGVGAKKELSLNQVDTNKVADCILIVEPVMFSPGKAPYVDVVFTFLKPSGVVLVSMFINRLYRIMPYNSTYGIDTDFTSSFHKAGRFLTATIRKDREQRGKRK